MSTSYTLSAFVGDPMDNPTLFRSTVGSLQYLSLIHSNLAFAVNRGVPVYASSNKSPLASC
jgi:hypothetical protein